MRLPPSNEVVVLAIFKLSMAMAQLVFHTGLKQDIRLQWAVSPDMSVAGSARLSSTYANISSASAAAAAAASKPYTDADADPSSSSTASPTLYLQMEAPSSSYNWIAVGRGARMLGADMFLLYASSPSDDNVTLSTRTGRHHVMPFFTPRHNVRLLSGSGIRDGRLRANIACLACSNLNISSNKTSDWIVAWSSIDASSPLSDSLRSSNPSAVIPKHDRHLNLRVSLAQAVLSSKDADPFAANDTSAAQTAGAIQQLDDDEAANLYDDDDDDMAHPAEDTILRLAHGIIMTAVFVLIYPAGSLLTPLFNKWFLHSMSQIVGFVCMWIAFVLGHVYARMQARLGTMVVSLLAIQPLLGYLHHRIYTAHQSNSLVHHVHVWYGRSLMLLGVINGGLGLQLAHEKARAWPIVYSAVAAVLALAYVAALAFRRSVRMGYLKGNKVSPGQQKQHQERQHETVVQEEFHFEASDPECLRVSRFN
ncbi:hypothetical protein E4U21_003584 [Claviceps maximensis]|nr:hypothetical protein E4U21_003584 [Claviceps maximensis]